jgi:hypothetical protein
MIDTAVAQRFTLTFSESLSLCVAREPCALLKRHARTSLEETLRWRRFGLFFNASMVGFTFNYSLKSIARTATRALPYICVDEVPRARAPRSRPTTVRQGNG